MCGEIAEGGDVWWRCWGASREAEMQRGMMRSRGAIREAAWWRCSGVQQSNLEKQEQGPTSAARA